MNSIAIDSKLQTRLPITPKQLTEFCQRWQIAELALFGSILRDDFHPDSDIDLLVSYQPTAKRGLFEKMRMKAEIESLLDREVDLVSKTAIQQSKNWLRRQNILTTAEIIYVA